MHFDPLPKITHNKSTALSFKSKYTELFGQIEMTKYNISFKIKNHVPAIFPNQIYKTNHGMTAVTLLMLRLREKKEILEVFPSIFIETCHIEYSRKATKSWLGYKRSILLLKSHTYHHHYPYLKYTLLKSKCVEFPACISIHTKLDKVIYPAPMQICVMII